MNRVTRLITSNNEIKSASLWKATSACSAMVLVAGLGFTTLTMSSPATAQDDRSETLRETTGATFPTLQSMEEGVAAEVKNGKLNQEQADMILRVFKRLSMGIESGKLTVDDALAILEQRARAIYADNDRKETAGSYVGSDIVLKIAAAAEAGEITPAQAAEYIVIAQNTIMAEEAYQAYEARIIAAHEAGEIDRREAGAKLEAFKKELGDKMIIDMKARMDASIEQGTMTEAEVEEVWAVYKKTSAGKGSNPGSSKDQVTRQDYANAQAKMQKMVEAGEITQQQMDAKLVEIRKMIGKSKTNAQPTVTRQDYANAQAEMQKMVDAGKITQEQMDARLVEMRKMIGKSRTNAQPTVTREDYAKAQAEMQKMVDAGKITQEQMDTRLGEMRQIIGRANRQRKAADGERNEVSDDCMELRSRLGTAIRNGDMTREEAGEIWNAEGCGR